MQSHAFFKLKTLAALALLAAALPVAQPARAASQVIATIQFAGPVAANPRQARAGRPTPQEVIHSLSNAAFSMCKRAGATVTRVDLIKRQATSVSTTGGWRSVMTRWNCVATN